MSGRPARRQPAQEAIDGIAVHRVGGHEASQFSVDLVAVARLVQARPGNGDHSGVGTELAVPVAQVQRRQQFAEGEAAGAAEDDEVARVNRSGGRHLSSSDWFVGPDPR